MAAIDQFHPALDFALEKLGKAELSLKEAQYEALKSVVFQGLQLLYFILFAHHVRYFFSTRTAQVT